MTRVNVSVEQKAVNGFKNTCLSSHSTFPVLASKRAISTGEIMCPPPSFVNVVSPGSTFCMHENHRREFQGALICLFAPMFLLITAAKCVKSLP